MYISEWLSDDVIAQHTASGLFQTQWQPMMILFFVRRSDGVGTAQQSAAWSKKRLSSGKRHHSGPLHGVEIVQQFTARSKKGYVNGKERQHSSLLQGVNLSNSSQLGIKKGYRGDNTALFCIQMCRFLVYVLPEIPIKASSTRHPQKEAILCTHIYIHEWLPKWCDSPTHCIWPNTNYDW